MRNTAESGTLTVRDFRTEGQLKRPATPLVPIYCALPIGAAVSSQMGTIPLDNHSVATWEEPKILAGEPNGPFAGGTPVAYDLANGESALLLLNTEQRDDFEGVIKATVQVGNKETVVTVPINDSDQAGNYERIFIPKFTLAPDFYITIGGSTDEELAKPFTWGYMKVDSQTSTRGTLPELVEVLEDLRQQRQ